MPGMDVDIMPLAEGPVEFSVLGASIDTGHMLLQRLVVLLLSNPVTGYRGGSGGYLLDLLEGANIPSDEALDSLLGVCCANALNMLDEDDRALVSRFTGKSDNGNITCTVELQDGTTVTGVI